MKLVEFLNPTLPWRSTLVGGLVVDLGGGIVYRLADPLGEFATRESIDSKLRVGLTEPDVIRSLGKEPAYRYHRDNAPADYYVKGWERRERPITGSVLIFMFGETICYVWFDERGRLEDFILGGS
jgi:hypothetical protein